MANLSIELNSGFVSRDREVEELRTLLTKPECRLVTIVGTGGIGKTRLALEVLSNLVSHFADGVFFVSLQEVTSPTLLISAIANCLNCPSDRLIDFLSKKKALLFLDNFEHLIEASDKLSELLLHAPHLKFLLSSRERLNLREEWVYELGGLSFPENDDENKTESYGAIQLFLQCAQRSQHHFQTDIGQKKAVSRICRLLEGMPLGIELAAAWVHVLSCEAIADEIQRSLDILESPVRNVLPRHRNMRAVIEPTWQRLRPEERLIYSKLAVFRGSFSLEAAGKVAGASRQNLLSFVEKSLLRLDAGQYHLHEVLRQFADEQLALSPEMNHEVRDLHAHYYLDFLREREQELVMLGAHTQAMERMLPNLDNIRVAWESGAEQGWLNDLASSMEGYWGFHCMRGSSREGAALFAETAAVLRAKSDTPDEARQKLIALALAFEGLCTADFDSERAKALAEESMALLGEKPSGKAYLIAIQLSANLAVNDAERLAWIEAALTIAKTADYGWWLPKNLIDLANMARKSGEHELAESYYHETLSSQYRHKNPAVVVSALQGLGFLRMHQGDYLAAKDFMEQALDIAYELHYSAAWWWLHSGIADVALLQGDYASAKSHYHQGLQISHDMAERYGMVFCLSGLASVVLALGDSFLAQKHLKEALSIAQELGDARALLDVLTTGVSLLMTWEEKLTASSLAKFILAQAETEALAKVKLKSVYQAGDEAEGIEGLTLERASQQLRQILNNSCSKTAKTPVEMLTRREIEVLSYIAEGLSNYEIAVRLFVGLSTVKTHIHHILSKLEVKNRSQAVIRARELGLF